MRWVNGGDIPLASNKSSVGFMNPPMIEYLYAATLRLWPDILSVAVMTMISGMLALAAAAWSAYKLFGKRAAFWAMLILAVNPWSVYYSQLIWNQTMVPVFSALTLASLTLYLTIRPRPIYLILTFVWAACMTQVHPGSAVQLLTVGLVLLVFRRRVRLWPLVVGVITLVLLYIPYLLYESGVGWGDVKAILEIGRQPASFSAAAVLVSVDLVRVRGLFGQASLASLFDPAATLLLALSLAFALFEGAHRFTQRRRDPEADRRVTGLSILLLWFAMPILFYLRSSTHLQLYYLISQFPAHFILVGVFADGAQSRLERLALQTRLKGIRAAALAIPALVLMLAAWQFGVNVQYQNHRFQNRSSDTQIRHLRSAIAATRRLLAERPDCHLVVVSEGHSVEMSNLSLLREFTDPERVLLSDGRLAIPLPTPCASYVDALPGSKASDWLLEMGSPLTEQLTATPGQVWSSFALSTDTWTKLNIKNTSQASPIRWDNGVSLADFAHGRIQVGTSMPLTLTWSVDAPPPEVVYHIGAYLLTDGNELVAQSDGPGYDSIQWQRGDWFITWFDIPVPEDLSPGTYHLAVAFYTWPGLERVRLESGDYTALLTSIEIAQR